MSNIAKKKKSGVTSLIGIENIDPILEKVDINDVCQERWFSTLVQGQ